MYDVHFLFQVIGYSFRWYDTIVSYAAGDVNRVYVSIRDYSIAPAFRLLVYGTDRPVYT